MAVEFGRVQITKTGRDVRVIADGNYQYAKSGGITLDMATVPVNGTGAPITLPDGTTVAAGQAYLRYGQFMARITASGLYGPYDPAATDGRQTPTRGAFGFLNQTWLDVPAGQFFAMDQGTTHPPLYEGGRCWRERLLFTAGTHSLAAGPTVAEAEAALPNLSYVMN
jgi:hypothetical protein